MYKSFREVILCVAFFCLFTQSAVSEEISFEEKQCAAWKTKKTMFLVSSQEPVGTNCSIEATFEKGDKGYFINVTVPISKFDSGDEDRDKDVQGILGIEKQKDLILTSKAKSLEEWKTTWTKGEIDEEIDIVIAGQSYSLPAKIIKVSKANTTYLTGLIITTYSAVSIEPPSVAGGIIASVDDYLELHFQLDTKQITGFDEVM